MLNHHLSCLKFLIISVQEQQNCNHTCLVPCLVGDVLGIKVTLPPTGVELHILRSMNCILGRESFLSASAAKLRRILPFLLGVGISLRQAAALSPFHNIPRRRFIQSKTRCSLFRRQTKDSTPREKPASNTKRETNEADACDALNTPPNFPALECDAR